MKKYRMGGWLAAVVILIGTAGANAADTSRVYVEFKPGLKNAAKGLVQQAGGVIHHEFDSLNAVASTLPTAALAGIRNNPNIVVVEDDPPRWLFGCTMVPEQVPFGLDAVQAPAVWGANHDGFGIKVGIIDSGVWTGHSDFTGVPINGEPSGWDTDGLGHGTHVTGTIAAQLNDLGVVGVSPGVSIHMVKVFGADGSWIYSSTLLNAAQKCQAAGCRIISMSLGGTFASRTEDRGFAQLYNAGILLVAAAGNDGNTRTSYPAGYASVISVAAVDQNKVVADFSQKNSDVELAAPGVGVLSTVPYCEQNTASGTGFSFSGNYIDLAARGEATGALVDGGIGDKVPPDGAWAGKVVLVQRGTISFYDKVRNVQAGDGVACIIYNNVSGDFLGTLSTGPSTIPAISLSLENGQALKAHLGKSTTVTSSVNPEQSGWAYYDGTSMATPHVSAAAALIWSASPTKSNASIRQALTATALDLGTAGRDTSYGYGLVQAKAALDYLAGADTTAPDISDVTSSIVNAKTGSFKITWTTDEPATSVVVFSNGATSSNTALVTSHSMTFKGTKGATYTYSVQSADAAGNVATAGPFTHQN